jgi:hypothetical protein
MNTEEVFFMKTKLTVALILVFVVALSFVACDKGSDAPITTGQPQQTTPGELPEGHPAPGSEGISQAPVNRKIAVKEEITAAWDSVRLSIEDKQEGKTDDVVVKIGETYTIPGSEVAIKVGAFLPDFKMDETSISSASGELNNPAVKVTVSEGGSEIFDAWLYSKFPSIHPFMHERYGITLKEPVSKG